MVIDDGGRARGSVAGDRELPSIRTSITLQLTTMLAAFRTSRRSFVRSFVTEHAQSTSPSSSASAADIPPIPREQTVRHRARLSPSPRQSTLVKARPDTLTSLPPEFGKNQLLSVSNSTRALLEEIVSQFNAPIRYAFAYGSGVFEQDGYAQMEKEGQKPMLDFVFAVRHPDHWHSINMNQYPSHYAFHARALGSDFVSRVQDVTPGLWFNAFVKVNGVVSTDFFFAIVKP